MFGEKSYPIRHKSKHYLELGEWENQQELYFGDEGHEKKMRARILKLAKGGKKKAYKI